MSQENEQRAVGLSNFQVEELARDIRQRFNELWMSGDLLYVPSLYFGNDDQENRRNEAIIYLLLQKLGGQVELSIADIGRAIDESEFLATELDGLLKLEAVRELERE